MSNQQERFIDLFTKPWMSGMWPTVWRVTLGVLMMAFHGAPKVLNGRLGSMAEDIAAKGWPMPEIQAFMAGYLEFAGGILLILGLLTRPVAFGVAVLFFIISFLYLGDDPFVAKEKAFLFMVMAIYVFFVGPGSWSVDHFLFKKNAVPSPDAPSEPPASV